MNQNIKITLGVLLVSILSMFALVLSFLFYNIPIRFELLLFCFPLTMIVYSFNKITDREEDKINNRESNKVIHIVSIIGSITMLTILTVLVGILPMMIGFVTLFIGILYSLRIGTFKIKNIIVIKNLVISFAWAFTASIMPLTVQSRPFNEIFAVFAYFFIMLFIDTVITDYLDVEGDLKSGVKTLYAKYDTAVIVKIMMISCIQLLLLTILNIPIIMLSGILVGMVYMLYAILDFYLNNRGRLYSFIVVDGMWIPVIMYLLTARFIYGS